ncbi:MAG: hypothetical protein C0467_05335 [Planctomycetaceae bacterium]|nr:hypothetical protein [Planctomycetaceae bacterium]
MWIRVMTELASGLNQLIFPDYCLICDIPEGDGNKFSHGLCGMCHDAVTNDPLPACPWCAATVGPHADTGNGCLACKGKSFAFDAAIRLGSYDRQLREVILRMKAANGESVAEQMGRILCARLCSKLSKLALTTVVPVPLHWQRRFARGHNQAAGIGRELATGLGIPFASSGLRRLRNTPQQGQPTASARQENVKGAFGVSRRARFVGETVLLVDDVMTTGSTASEAARVIKKAGARSVFVAVLARR